MSNTNENRKPSDVGASSPPNEEAKEQLGSGFAGAEAQGGPAQKQPAQASNRRGAQHEEPAHVRKSFEEGNAPSEQGDQSNPSPERIAQHQQGLKPQSGSHRSGDRSQEAAVSGEPKGEHTRSGRQSVPGDRKPEA